MTSEQDKNAKPILEKVGMQVTVFTPMQVERFRKPAQPPPQDWAEKEIGKPYVDSLFKGRSRDEEVKTASVNSVRRRTT